ncbi:hypothetical protein [Streptomyces sp. NPDC058542]
MSDSDDGEYGFSEFNRSGGPGGFSGFSGFNRSGGPGGFGG